MALNADDIAEIINMHVKSGPASGVKPSPLLTEIYERNPNAKAIVVKLKPFLAMHCPDVHWEGTNGADMLLWKGAPWMPALPTQAAGGAKKSPIGKKAVVGVNKKVGRVSPVAEVLETSPIRKDANEHFASIAASEPENAHATFEGGHPLDDYFQGDYIKNSREEKQSLFEYKRDELKANSALFGTLLNRRSPNGIPVALNLEEPFCLVATGVQGSGKSHTIGTIVESCLMQMPPHINLRTPMSALVLHYDQAAVNPCECASLMRLKDDVRRSLLSKDGVEPSSLPKIKKCVVLTSPSYFLQRKAMYETLPDTEVRPLLFSFRSLDVAQLRVLMRFTSTDNQLYANMMMERLRAFQRRGGLPKYEDFRADITKYLDSEGAVTQLQPFLQRLSLLDELIAESAVNSEKVHQLGNKSLNEAYGALKLNELMEPGTMVIADISDSMLDTDAARGIFQILLENFRDFDVSHGKLCVLDEAHKYLDVNKKSGLTESIVYTVRMMRHYGIRVAISTQSPLTLPPEVLELTKIAVCHKFFSRDWATHLAKKLPLSKSVSDVMTLKPGEALVYAANHGLRVHQDPGDDPDSDVLKIRIRPRLTMDGGNSRIHRGKSEPGAPPLAEHKEDIEEEEEEEKPRRYDSSGDKDYQDEYDKDDNSLSK